MKHLIIPSRYGSTRFPGKPLARICGVPMVVRTAQACMKAHGFDDVFVLTDHVGIYEACVIYSISCVLWEFGAVNGTDRIARWVVDRLPDDDIIINVQGDEPMMDVGIINRLLFHVEQKPGFVWTAVRKLLEPEKESRDVVKANVHVERIWEWSRNYTPGLEYVQLGVYGYTVKRLREYLDTAPTIEEQAEGLEQLRWNEPLACISVDYDGIAVDRPSDIARVEERIMAH